MSSSRGNYSNSGEPRGNMWSGGSRGGGTGGSRGNFSRSDNDENRTRGRGQYRGSYQNTFSRRGSAGAGGGYGFRRNQEQTNNDEEVEIMKDVIFIQNLPKDITHDDIHEAFSTVGPIKVNDRTGGPRIWIYKDRTTNESNGRATVTYENEETAQKAISEYNDQHIDSLNTVVHVQLAQRRGSRNSNRGFRGGGRGRGRGRDNGRPNSGSYYDSMRRGGGGGDRGRGSYRGGHAAGTSY